MYEFDEKKDTESNNLNGVWMSDYTTWDFRFFLG